MPKPCRNLWELLVLWFCEHVEIPQIGIFSFDNWQGHLVVGRIDYAHFVLVMDWHMHAHIIPNRIQKSYMKSDLNDRMYHIYYLLQDKEFYACSWDACREMYSTLKYGLGESQKSHSSNGFSAGFILALSSVIYSWSSLFFNSTSNLVHTSPGVENDSTWSSNSREIKRNISSNSISWLLRKWDFSSMESSSSSIPIVIWYNPMLLRISRIFGF